MRGRPNRNKGHGHGHTHRNSSFESNGPDGKVRGNATQVHEKYLSLAREAASSGDRVLAETLFQHAEHYYRVLNESTDPRPEGMAPVQSLASQERDSEGRATRRNGGYAERQPDVPPQAMGFEVPLPSASRDKANAESKPQGNGPERQESPGDGTAPEASASPAAATTDSPGRSEGEGRRPRRGRPPLSARSGDGKDEPAEGGGARPRRGRPRKRAVPAEDTKAEPAGDGQGEEASGTPGSEEVKA
jgi:hypothetical protein